MKLHRYERCQELMIVNQLYRLLFTNRGDYSFAGIVVYSSDDVLMVCVYLCVVHRRQSDAIPSARWSGQLLCVVCACMSV